MPGESGAPALDFENYKKFYGFGIPKWSPYYYVTEADDKANSESLKRFHNEGGGSLPTFKDHEELRGHLLNMSDTELNRMRDFGCGKPHWSPYYVEAAYQNEAGVIPGDSQSMKHTRPLKPPTPVSARSALPPSDSGSRQSSRGSAVPNLKMASSMDATTFINSARSNRSQLLASARSAQASSRSNQNSARSTASMRESRRIEDLLLTKEREIQELREQLAMTKH
ncbi:hypothetical protein ScalyP_jg7709 [Parmales sp. scaly parma]|nr:hypothetical protein ScalyP_jg7709 [Parmales sp. scaly parma]